MTSPRPTVVVTGLGATTPLGGTAEETWQALLAGRPGARAFRRILTVEAIRPGAGLEVIDTTGLILSASGEQHDVLATLVRLGIRILRIRLVVPLLNLLRVKA